MSCVKIYTKEKDMASINKITPAMISFKKYNPAKEDMSPDCFRDDELFNPEKDCINTEYRQYDLDDIPVSAAWGYRKPIVNRKYLEANALTDTPKYNIDTSNLIYERYKAGSKDYYIEAKTPEEILEKAAILRQRRGFFVSKDLLKYLKEIHNEYIPGRGYFSAGELADICEASKLRKADMTEYVDKEMIEAGLYWANRVISNDNHIVKQVLRSMVKKDEDGNEYFDKRKNAALKKMNVSSNLFKQEISSQK